MGLKKTRGSPAPVVAWEGVCLDCGVLTMLPPKRKICYSCKYARHGKGRSRTEKARQYAREYHRNNPHFARYKAHRHFDKSKGHMSSLTWKDYQTVVYEGAECFYCGHSVFYDLGIDRKHSNEGHSLLNVVACCEKCNYILSDLDFEAKMELAPGLRAIRTRGLFDNWVLPTKRNKAKN